MQLAATVNGEDVGIGGVLDAQRDVGHELARQALAQVAAGHVLAVATGQRGGVDLELHRQSGLVDVDHRQCLRRVDRAERGADVQHRRCR